MRSRSDSTSKTEEWSQVAGLLLGLGFYSKSVSMEIACHIPQDFNDWDSQRGRKTKKERKEERRESRSAN